MNVTKMRHQSERTREGSGHMTRAVMCERGNLLAALSPELLRDLVAGQLDVQGVEWSPPEACRHADYCTWFQSAIGRICLACARLLDPPRRRWWQRAR